MALPQTIERQAAEAEQLQKDIYEDQAPASTEEQPASTDESTETPVVTADVVELLPPAEPATREEDTAYWKKRFETVQGKLDAEMPRLFEQLRNQGETIKQLSTQLQTKEQQEAPSPAATETLVTQTDIDAFGDDLIDAMRRTAREEVGKVIAVERAALEQRFGAVETQVGEVGQQVVKTAVDTFWGDVAKLVPDWPVVDKNPAWISWLDTSPEYAETSYRELAAQAIQKGSPQKIAKLVDTWKKETEQAPPPEIPPVDTSRSSELERQVAPSTVTGTTLPVSRKTYTRQDYETLYDVRNVARYGEKKAAEMIAEADLAVAENRVRWT